MLGVIRPHLFTLDHRFKNLPPNQIDVTSPDGIKGHDESPSSRDLFRGRGRPCQHVGHGGDRGVARTKGHSHEARGPRYGRRVAKTACTINGKIIVPGPPPNTKEEQFLVDHVLKLIEAVNLRPAEAQ